MRNISDVIKAALANTGPMVGEFQPVTRVTVQPDWYLNTTSGPVGTRPLEKLPVRWWQDAGNTQFPNEVELPPMKSVIIDRALTEPAGTIELVLYNTYTPTDGVAHDTEDAFGRPGVYSYARGLSSDSLARWGQHPNQWRNLFRENALLRVYQGYGGQELALGDAINAGNVMLTGVFLVDNVVIEAGTSGGLITLNGRDMAKLLIDQFAWPPTIPQAFYTTAGIEYYYAGGTVTPAVTAQQNQIFAAFCQYLSCSGSTGDAAIDGHIPSSCTDANASDYYLSEGKTTPNPVFAPTIAFTVNSEISAVKILPPQGFGGYTCYVCIQQESGWVTTGGTFQGHDYVTSFSPHDTDGWATLPTTYQCTEMELVFDNLIATDFDPVYRAALASVQTGLNGLDILDPQGSTDPGINVFAPRVEFAQNYDDYSQIADDFLQWAGFHLGGDVADDAYSPTFGHVEYSGAYNSLGPIPASTWDKKSIMDCVQICAQVVGYIFRIGERGEVWYASPNWWSPGNYGDENNYSRTFPILDEQVNLTDWIQTTSDASMVSEIIVSPDDPYIYNNAPAKDTVTRFVPPNIGGLHGINKPVMIGIPLNVPVSAEDQAAFAELLAVQCYMAIRQGQATAKFDPSITPDTQIKIYDRVTGDSNIHYVTGVHSEHDLDTGTHLATYTTYWLGDDNNWVINSSDNSFLAGSVLSSTTYNDQGIIVSQTLLNFLKASGSTRLVTFTGGSTNTETLSDLPIPFTEVGQESASGYAVSDAGGRIEDYSYGVVTNPSVAEG